MIDLLMHGTVVTMGATRSVLEDGAVAVDHGHILAIGQCDEQGERQYAWMGEDTATLPAVMMSSNHRVGSASPSMFRRSV